MSLPKKINTAIIFAAGMGSRMRPLTEHIPKPLVQVNGKALLDYTLDTLCQNDITNVIVNTHYHAEQIHTHIAHRINKQGNLQDITISYEPELLETGGAIVKALPYIKEDYFFSLNSDVILIDPAPDSSIQKMIKRWNPAIMDGLLLLQPINKATGYDGKGNFDIDPDTGQLLTSNNPQYVFTGIQILSRTLFTNLTLHKFSLRELYFKNSQTNLRLYGVIHHSEWLHIGTTDAIELANQKIAKLKTSA